MPNASREPGATEHAVSPRARGVLYAAVAGFVIAMTIAIASYPGGSYFDANYPGYDFWRNFWCDLLRAQAFNGAPNRVAPTFAHAAMWSFGIALVPFFWALSELGGDTRNKRLVTRVLGLFGVVGMLGVAVLPSSRFPTLHGVLVTTSGPIGITAAAFAFGAAWRSGTLTTRAVVLGCVTLALAALNVLQYGREFWLRVPSSPLLPGLQKLVTVALIAWMLEVARAPRKPQPRRRSGG